VNDGVPSGVGSEFSVTEQDFNTYTSALSINLTCCSPWAIISREMIDVSEKFVLQPIVWNATHVVGLLILSFSC